MVIPELELAARRLVDNLADLMWIAGVDGCRAGWVVVLAELVTSKSRRPRDLQTLIVPTFMQVLALRPRPAMIAVDMPIGFADIAEPGGRPCDRVARAELGVRASTIFSPPSRPALDMFRALRAASNQQPATAGGRRAFAKVRHSVATPWCLPAGYREVCTANRTTGPDAPAISLQAFHLLPKLVEVDDAISPSLQRRVREAHPELAFLRANDGRHLPPKKSPAGKRARNAILERLGLLPPDLRSQGVGAGRGSALDDLYDAAILCDVARRIVRGTATVRGVQQDTRRLRMEIVT